MKAIYMLDGKGYRLCDCDQSSETCQRGVRRSLMTRGFSQCLIPVELTDAWLGVTEDYIPASDDESGMNLCRQLERALAKYEQAELPEEPGGPNSFEDEVDYISAHFAYASALRTHAARMQVELDEAKERAERAERGEQLMIRNANDWKAASESAERRAEENARAFYSLATSFRVNILRIRPETTHEEITAIIDAARSEEGKHG